SVSRAAEGRQHPERDAQFRYIAALAAEHAAAGQPVISVDAKKKEPVGDFGQAGRGWRPAGDPAAVRSHDFPEKDGRHAIPYGVYDEAANAGFVNVGTDGNTAALAVESVRRWWQLAGKDAYPAASRLLVTCDAGGSNAAVSRGWKAGLAELARETGLDITVCHFPPGTSKWNKIEHRLFCQITLAWRGRPLTSYDVIIDTIGHVTTRTGLACTAVLDENAYPTGTEIPDQVMKDVEDRQLARHDWHGDWNYTLLASPRPAPPPPEPPPAPRPRLLAPDEPARPAPRTRAPCKRGSRRRLETAGYLCAALLKRHLGVPSRVTAEVLGISDSVVRHMIRTITAVLAEARTSLPPPAGPPPRQHIRTLSDLRGYAARHGIHIPAPETDTAPETTLARPDTPTNHLIPKRSLFGRNNIQ